MAKDSTAVACLTLGQCVVCLLGLLVLLSCSCVVWTCPCCRWFLPFMLAALFGAGDAVWESQPPAVLQSSSFLPNERDRDAAMSSTCFCLEVVFGVDGVVCAGHCRAHYPRGRTLGALVPVVLCLSVSDCGGGAFVC